MDFHFLAAIALAVLGVSVGAWWLGHDVRKHSDQWHKDWAEDKTGTLWQIGLLFYFCLAPAMTVYLMPTAMCYLYLSC
jgi:hypothetical protein